MPTLTINGQLITAPSGATVLEAAQQNSIPIPTLCHHPALKSVGACRLCVVEIDGMRGEPTSCTTPASDGMVVRTDTLRLQELRREVLSLILSEHPYTCLVCDRHERCNEWQVTIRKAGVTTGCENCPKNGQCKLQNLVEEIGLSLMPYTISYRGLPVEKEDPFFDRDYNLCILCGRCVRMCQDVRRTGTLAFTHRGSQALVGTAFGQSHLAVDCEFCGACVDVCPTGALYDKRSKWEGAPERAVTTICPYCSVGCQLDLWVKQGKVMGVRPTPEGAANQGQACVRGRFGIIDLIHSPDRLRTPLLRKQGRLVESSWEEALPFAAAALQPYTGDCMAMLISPHLTTESAYVLQKYARLVMGSRFVDSPTALPRFPQAASLAEKLQTNHRPTLHAIREARCILVIGANPRRSHPVVAVQIRQAQAAGAKLIVIDPRRTELARRADIWLPVDPGKDAGLLRRLTKGGHDDHDLRNAAEMLHQHAPVAIVYGSGVTHYPEALQTLRAIDELSAVIQPQAYVIPLPGAANTLGVLAAGAAATTPETNYDAIIQGISSRQIKALYLTGEMPLSDELANLELLIVQDSYISTSLAEMAHIVFPSASFAEISGSLINLEGLVQRFGPAIPPVGESRPDWWIAAELAQVMGAPGFEYKNAAEIWQEIEAQTQSTASTIPSMQFTPLSQDGFAFTLITERNPFSYRSNALTDRVRGMERICNEENITIHPADAARLGIAEGDLVRVSSAYGNESLLAQLNTDLPEGMVFASFNNAHGSSLFPGKLPGIKAYPVNIERSL
jgi:predicted molibdopterin-dependent oxidoreductase YjgC